MELEEAEKELAALKTKLTSKDSEITRILSKNDELLAETKQAKRDRTELKDSVTTLKQELTDFKNQKDLGDENMQKVEELVAVKLDAKQTEFDTKTEELSEQLLTAQNGFSALQQKYNGERISGAIRKAAEKAGVIPGAIDDVIARAHGMFSVSEEGAIEARDNDGNLAKIGKKIASPDVFVESLKESAEHLWPGSKGTGAKGSKGGGAGGPNPYAKETFNLTQQAKLVKSDPQRAEQLKAQAAG